MGRPRLAADDIRYRRDLRLSNSEWSALVERADRAGLPPAIYAREVLIGHRVGAAANVRDRSAWAELARVHSNLNQIAAVVNSARLSGKEDGIDYAAIADALDACQRQTKALRAEILGARQSESEREPDGES